MIPLTKGKYRVRPAQDAADLDAVLTLRGRCFGSAGGRADRFDTIATHTMVERTDTSELVASYRMATLRGARIGDSYAAQYYDLRALETFDGPLLELGRFCIHPDHCDPDILRIAWAALTAHVDATDVSLLFGCASFEGTDPAPYLNAFALLKHRHLAPARWAPRPKAPEIFAYAGCASAPTDGRVATAGLPPLLRTYLMMGGWVSDHAVIDREMGTLHVFTGLEIGAIPPARKRLLRALV